MRCVGCALCDAMGRSCSYSLSLVGSGDLVGFVLDCGCSACEQMFEEANLERARRPRHRHAGAYSPDCEACQGFDDRMYVTLANTGRTSRPAPMSARNVRIRLHDLDYVCVTCRPFLGMYPDESLGKRLFVWLCRQWWDWTPAAQLIYWMYALAAVATY